MNESFLIRMFLAAGIWVAEATAVLLGAWLLTHLFRRNASLRHFIWLIAFCAALLIPCLSAVVPSLVTVRTSAPTRMGDYLRSSAGRKWEIGVKAGLPLAKNRQAAVSPDAPPARVISNPRYGTPIRLFLLWVWLGGVVVVALQGVAGVYGLRVLRRHSGENPFDALFLAELAARMGLTRAWELRVSDTATPPVAMTWGVMRPVVLLPRDAIYWPKERLEAVLLHELAHVRRYDSVSQALAFIVCALHWFHPAVWRAARALRAEAEVAADDIVLLSGVKPSSYASQLLYFAAHLGQKRQPFAVIGVSLMKQSKIETRILSIVDSSRRRRLLTPFEAMRAGGFGLLTALLLASVRPATSSASAQQEPLTSLKPTSLLSSLRQTLNPLTPPKKAVTPKNRSRRGSPSGRAARPNPDVLVTPRPKPRPVPRPSPDVLPVKPKISVPSGAAGTIPTRSADATPVMPQASGDKRATFSSDAALQQRTTAEADRRRGMGNAHGKGEADEAMAKRREADIRKAIPDGVAADRFISEADRMDALRRQEQW